MSEVAINDIMFDFVLDNITRRFEKSDYELVLTYIIETYVLADSCENDGAKLAQSDLSDQAITLLHLPRRIHRSATASRKQYTLK